MLPLRLVADELERVGGNGQDGDSDDEDDGYGDGPGDGYGGGLAMMISLVEHPKS